jgi:cytoskeletal protein CcmA (bactofilin family)
MSDDMQLKLFSVPRKVVIEGSISFPGTIIVDGKILGDVCCGSILIRERGMIEGSVRAEEVTVMGEISGEVFANNLTLKTACSVIGEIFHRELTLENGCYFEGKSRHHLDPLKLVTSEMQ